MSPVIQAFISVFSVTNLLMIFAGTLAGIIIGALPGLTVNMGIALLLPLTFSFQGMTGILMLMGVYCGAIYGGSISAILINTPGTPASAATTIDGYPMAIKHGQPGRALGLSTFASTFGGLFSAVMLILLSPQLARVAVGLSAPEYFALAVFGISIITSVSSKSIIKGLIGGAIGLLIATIGLDPMTAAPRFTYGSLYLMGGVSFVPVLVGLFAFSQGLLSLEESYGEEIRKVKVKIGRVFPTGADFKRIFPTLLRSSVIGTFIGAVPGTGGDIASFISYTEAKRWSKHKEDFGDGAPEGIAAPESGNNAVSGGALVPLLSLGIPGDGATAIMMGAFMVQGLSLGPLLFKEHPVEVNIIFIGLLLANVIMGALGFLGIRLFTQVINVPKKVLVPLILVLCAVGSYSVNHTMIDVFVMMGFGLAGYVLLKLDFSMSPIVIGIILGPMAEANLRRALIMSGGDASVLVTRPISAIFLAVAVVTLFSPMLGAAWKGRKKGKAE
jgi:putative tricarboxylic transport membrane protein